MPKTTRRGFIQVALGAATALTAPAILPLPPPGITTPIHEPSAAKYFIHWVDLDYESNGGPAHLSLELDGKPLLSWLVSGERVGRETARVYLPPDTLGGNLRFTFKAKGGFKVHSVAAATTEFPCPWPVKQTSAAEVKKELEDLGWPT